MPRKSAKPSSIKKEVLQQDNADDNISNYVNDPNRARITDIYKDKLRDMLSFEKIYEIEKSIYNWALTEADRLNIARNWNEDVFQKMYEGKCYCVLSNLYPRSEFTDKIIYEHIPSHLVGDMKPEEMAPEKWKGIISTVKDRVKNAYEVRMESMTRNVRCRKCKSNRIFYTEVQTRSADEPMTTIYQCLECNSKWKN